ncbi:MAG: hypothetical protein ACM3PO_08555 [Betaproteobacteria bacterium]
MRRREFIMLLGGAAVARQQNARAEQPEIPLVGLLNGSSPKSTFSEIAAFQNGLKEAGFVKGEMSDWAEQH